MIAAFLLATAVPSAVDAERAFAADAQKLGQWTAFRKWSAEGARMFVPQPVEPHEFLADKKDPSASLTWSPSKSFVSCDGGHAVNVGPWTSASGISHGYFTTLWVRQPDRTWKWIYDGGNTLAEPLAVVARPISKRASCAGRPSRLPKAAPLPSGFNSGQGESADHSMHWTWTVSPKGDRRFVVHLWDGNRFNLVIAQKIAAPK